MSQTQRTLAALVTILADNVSGAISPEDIRDMLVSLTPSRGGMTIEPAGSLVTGIVTTATWTTLAGTWTSNGEIDMRDWSMSANGVLKYSGTESQAALITGKVGLTPGAGNTEYSLAYALNGTANERFAASHRFAGAQAGTARTTMPITAMITIATNDEISLMVRNDTGTEDCTAHRATLSVIGFIK